MPKRAAGKVSRNASTPKKKPGPKPNLATGKPSRNASTPKKKPGPKPKLGR